MTASSVSAQSLISTRRGKAMLALLCAVGFIDFIDGPSLNVALPSIRHALAFSLAGLQWVPSAYLVTFGGFAMVGGRMADLYGRRRMLLWGIVLVGIASVVGGFAPSAGVLVGARLSQGVGAALTVPAALSILTTRFDGAARTKALAVWGTVASGSFAASNVMGGIVTEWLGWRWVLAVIAMACALLMWPALRLLGRDAAAGRGAGAQFDTVGAVTATVGTLVVMYAVVTASQLSWQRGVVLALIGVTLLGLFAVNERRNGNPLVPRELVSLKGLVCADLAQLGMYASYLSMFFVLTLFMQNVLHYGALVTGLAYLPLNFGVSAAALAAPRVIERVGTRPVIVAGAVIAGCGMAWLSRLPLGGGYVRDLLPGLLAVAVGAGAAYVGVATAATWVAGDQAGVAAAILSAAQAIGGAVGLAVCATVVGSSTNNSLAAHVAAGPALDAGLRAGLLVSLALLVVAACFAARATQTRGE